MVDILNGLKPDMMPPRPEDAFQESGKAADEKAQEGLSESREQFLEHSTDREAPLTPQAKKIETASSSASTTSGTSARTTDEVTLKIEKILEEDMGDLYKSMTPDTQIRFKKKGEEIAVAIAEMVRTLKVHAAKLIRLIRDWLHMIPKINKFFLEQEAKIKADEIIEYIEAKKEDANKLP